VSNPAQPKLSIAYGVMGYGRGHAMRTAAVLPALAREHAVTVFAGGDAHAALHEPCATLGVPLVRIPTIGYVYGRAGRHSNWLTFTRNFSLMNDLLIGGYGSRLVEEEFRSRRIGLVISDSEAWTHRAARRLGLPRISFDHVGIMAYCRPRFAAVDRLRGPRDALGYLYLMGQPERALVSSFYPAPPRRPTTTVVGPILRDDILAAKPATGDYLLAYFNKGEHQFRERTERALRGLQQPVIVYGTSRRGVHGNLDFRAPGRASFVRDLAGCRAVLCTAGNQLISEALYLVKPVLVLPEDAVEQRLNAVAVEDLRIGMAGELERLTTARILAFLDHLEHYRGHMRRHRCDGRTAALDSLQAFIHELAGRSPRLPSAAGRLRHALG
jgi:uncharacterized protein (TIGR00661 family)